MRRADRLFAILQMLRGGRLRRAEDIATVLEVSVRTIYRDIADLQGQGAPLDGERGLGYLLRDGFFLPPLALSPDEVDALRWGVAFVRAYGDDRLATAAAELQVKLDKRVSTQAAAPWFLIPGVRTDGALRQTLRTTREAVRARRKLSIAYVDLDHRTSDRIIRPLNIARWSSVWTLTGWCELRNDFRVFRIDRLSRCVATGAGFADEAGKRFSDYLAQFADKLPPPAPSRAAT